MFFCGSTVPNKMGVSGILLPGKAFRIMWGSQNWFFLFRYASKIIFMSGSPMARFIEIIVVVLRFGFQDKRKIGRISLEFEKRKTTLCLTFEILGIE